MSGKGSKVPEFESGLKFSPKTFEILMTRLEVGQNIIQKLQFSPFPEEEWRVGRR